MSFKNVLPVAFNMSLGLVPAIISMIFSGVMAPVTTLLLGAVIGIVYIVGSHYLFQETLIRFILIISTAVLLLLALLGLSPFQFYSGETLSIGLETAIILLLITFYIFSNRIRKVLTRKKGNVFRQIVVRSLDATAVSIRVIAILGVIHLLIMLLVILFAYPLSPKMNFLFYRIFPPVIFMLAILFNQAGLTYFNSLMSDADFIPIVDEKGNVTGRTLKVEALNYKNSFINPVVRIAVICNGMLFLCDKSQKCTIDQGKIDIPLESYLKYGETLDERVNTIMEDAFPGNEELEPRFSIKHKFKNEMTYRLIYLYTLELPDETLLKNPRFKGGKLWTMHQIEQNIDKGIFGECFTEEFDYLKDIIYIKEIYKEV